MEDKKNRLRPSQIASLELLNVFKDICGKYGFSYCLIGDAVTAIQEGSTFLPWLPRLAAGMFYNDYKKFIDICNEELKGTDFYLSTHYNTEQFDEIFIKLAKRGRVKLGKDRENDEKYYDFYFEIYPIFYAGNTIKEYKQLKREYLRYSRIIYSAPILPGIMAMFGLGCKQYINNIIHSVKNSLYYSKKGTVNYDEVVAGLAKYKSPTKYVLIPNFKLCEKNIEAWQYIEKKKYLFEDKECYSVANTEQYVKNMWGDNYKEAIKDKTVDRTELEGGEILRRIQLIELDLLIEFDRICRKHNIKYIIAAGTALGAVRHKGFIPWDDDADVFMLYDDYKRFLDVADSELDHSKYFLKTQASDKDCNLAFAQLKRNNTIYTKANREKFDTHPGAPLDIHPIFNAHPIRPVAWCIERICKFYKTMTWAHIGAETEKRPLQKWYYTLLAKKGNKYAYEKFIKYATLVKKKTKQVSNVYVFRNTYANPTNKRSIYENIEEIEFEGRMFYAPKQMDYYLTYSYSKDYMCFPPECERKQKHMTALVDVGDLYKDLKIEEVNV